MVFWSSRAIILSSSPEASLTINSPSVKWRHDGGFVPLRAAPSAARATRAGPLQNGTNSSVKYIIYLTIKSPANTQNCETVCNIRLAVLFLLEEIRDVTAVSQRRDIHVMSNNMFILTPEKCHSGLVCLLPQQCWTVLWTTSSPYRPSTGTVTL